MIGLNTIRLALRAIRRNLMRSVLTTLGIVIGVAAVVTMVTVGNGATRAVQAQIQSLGSNLLMVRPGQRQTFGGGGGGGAPPFKLADVQAVATQIGGVAAVAPEVRSAATVVAEGRNWSTTVTGSSNDYFAISNWKLASGRLFEPAEEAAGAAVCVIGATVRRELFGSADPLGQQLRVRRISCTVVGVLAGKGQGGMGLDQDDFIVVPTATAQRRLTGSTRVNTLLVSLQPGSDAARVKKSLAELLRERRKLGPADDDNFNVLDTQQIAETLSGTTRLLTSLLGAVAAVSLLVGGIGIMNIMLVSGDRAHARDRPAPGHRCLRTRGAGAVSGRGGGAGGAGRAGGPAAGAGGVDRPRLAAAGAVSVHARHQRPGLRLLGLHRRHLRLRAGAPGRTARPDRRPAPRVINPDRRWRSRGGPAPRAGGAGPAAWSGSRQNPPHVRAPGRPAWRAR